MAISAFELFKVGIGPSSSHTVGPMIAAARFAEVLVAGDLSAPGRVLVELFGSLGHTGRAHGSDVAVVLGLAGERGAYSSQGEARDGVRRGTRATCCGLLAEAHAV